MFSIQEQSAKMHFHSHSEKNGNEIVPAATLVFKFHAPNDVLSEFSPDLKSSLYRRPEITEGDMADNADPRLDDPNYLPRLKFPSMSNTIKIDHALVGSTVTVHYGIRGKSDIILDESNVGGFEFDPQDGGTVFVTLKVACHPSNQQAGDLHGMQDQEVVFTIQPPEEPQGELLDKQE